MPKLEGVKPTDHLVTLNNEARGWEILFWVREVLPDTGSLVVDELGKYDERRQVILNWTGSRYRDLVNEEDYDLQIHPLNAILKITAEQMGWSASPGPRLVKGCRSSLLQDEVL